MIRLVVTILTILTLNAVALAASAHGVGMAAETHTGMAGAAHAQAPCHPAPGLTPSPGGCDMHTGDRTGGGPAAMALCGWLCTGMAMPVATQDAPARKLVTERQAAMPAPMLAGLSPAPNERPPNPSLP